MKSTGIMTLFSEQPPPRRAPSSFVISLLVHGLAFAWLMAGLSHLPKVNDHPAAERYTVRILAQPKPEQARLASIDAPAHFAVQSVARDPVPSGGSGVPAPLALPVPEAHLPPRSQTLIQPEAPPNLMLPQETPVPFAVMWAPETLPSKTIVAPPQQEPTVVQTRPAIIKPNREPRLADVNIAATKFPTETPMVQAGATSPLVVRGPERVQQAPTTASTHPEQPTPARVISLSPLQSDGPVVIPFANQAAQAKGTQLAPSLQADGTGGGGDSSGNGNGTVPGDGAGNSKGTGASGNGNGAIAQGGTGTRASTGSNSGSAGGSHLGTVPDGVVHITLPKDGQYGVVVIGSSLAEKYPEIAGIWGGRLVYTVYLHVGLGKNWILQYSVPPIAEAAAGGKITKPEAPWPYDILRPHLAPEDYTSDAIMVHGFINLAGKFEQLALVFPVGFAQAKFVLNALEQWQFRPASQNGQLAAVEVLLIIPEETTP